MIPPDLAFAQFCNQTAIAYRDNAPAYMTYRERTHITAPSLHREQEIDRTVMVRVRDNAAVMRDLPSGGRRTGPAFPIIPYFDPLAGFSYTWFANLRRVDITLQREQPHPWPVPQSDATVNVVAPYLSFWLPTYAADSTVSRPHFTVLPTPALQSGQLYPYDVIVDSKTGLPSHLELRFQGDATTITLDYQTLEGHWVITHATYNAPQRFGPLTFAIVSDTSYENIAFPQVPPDPRLAGGAPSAPETLH